MVGAAKEFRVTLFDPTDQHPTMAAGVEEDADLPVGAATYDYRFLAHETGHEVAWVWNLAFMPDVQPASRKDPFLLRLMDFRIGKHPRADRLALEVYQFFRVDQLTVAPITMARHSAPASSKTLTLGDRLRHPEDPHFVLV
jgi:hypothetical protein